AETAARPLPPPLHGDRETSRAGVAARVCRRASDARAADTERTTRFWRASHENDAVNVVLRGHGVRNADPLRTARNADRLVDRAVDGRCGQVEPNAGDYKCARPGIVAGPAGRPVRHGGQSAAARSSGVQTQTSRNREGLARPQRAATDEAAGTTRADV